MFLARLKPYNPRGGYTLKRFGMPKAKRPENADKRPLTASLIFEAGLPAQEVSAEDAEALRKVHEIDGNLMTPLAFDVWDPDKEPPPPEMPIAMSKAGAITAQDLHGAFVPRSEIDAIVAREVAKALAAIEAQKTAAAGEPPAPVAPPAPVEDKGPSREKIGRYFQAADKAKK